MSNKEEKKQRKKRRKAPFIIAGIVVVLVVVRLVACGGNAQTGTLVTTTQPVRGELQESISTTGTILSEEVKVIFAPVSGTLGEVKVEAGDAVKAGDVLVSYDVSKLEASMKESELQQQKSAAVYDAAQEDNSKNEWKLYEANHNLEILNQQIADTKQYIKDLQNELSQSQRDTNNALAKESLDLNNKLKDLQTQLGALAAGSPEYLAKEKEIQDTTNAISYNQYVTSIASNSDYVNEMQQKISDAQETLSSYEKYKSEMEAQQTTSEGAVMNSYDQTQRSVDKELAEMSYRSAADDFAAAQNGIKADFDGIVTACSAIPGAGVVSGTQLLTLENSKNLKISFNATKNEVEKLALGQKADVVISGKTYAGEISKINRMAEKNASGTPLVGVEIHLLETDDTIILGMDAKITVYTKKADDALMIPVEAINADRDGDFLYVAENGIAVKKPVVCGISTDQYTEILEGITQEDVVIVTSYTNLEEGMAVTVMPGL